MLAGTTTGIKPSNVAVAQGLIGDAKLKSLTYCLSTLESTTPQVRKVFENLLTDTLHEQERLSQFVTGHGWYKSEASPEELMQQALSQANTGIQSIGK
jgi:spore coat protein CotF